MPKFKTRIMTPEKSAFDGDVDSLVVPGVDGSYGILSSHAPMIAAVAAGVIKMGVDGQKHSVTVGEGVLEVVDGQVVILTDRATVTQGEA